MEHYEHTTNSDHSIFLIVSLRHCTNYLSTSENLLLSLLVVVIINYLWSKSVWERHKKSFRSYSIKFSSAELPVSSCRQVICLQGFHDLTQLKSKPLVWWHQILLSVSFIETWAFWIGSGCSCSCFISQQPTSGELASKFNLLFPCAGGSGCSFPLKFTFSIKVLFTWWDESE